MSDSEIQIDAGTGGIYVDTSLVSTGAGASVNRQRVTIADATQGENFWAIGSDGAGSVHVVNPATSVSASVNVTVASVTVASVSVLNYPPIQVVSGSVSVLNQGGAGSNVNVTNAYIPITQEGNWGASVSNFPAVQTVSQSGAWSASVDGTVVATQGGSWSVGQSGAPWTASVQGQLPVTQATSPWLVSQSGAPWGASVQGTVVSTQGTSPWLVSQSGSPWGASVQGTVVATQGTSPWVVSGTSSVSGSVTVLNPVTTVTANQGGAPWTVDAIQEGNWGASVSNFPATQAVTQSTNPWVVSGSVSAIASGSVAVANLPPSTAVTQSTSPWVTSGSVSVLNPAASVQLLPSSSDIGYVGTWPTSGPIVGQTSSSVKAVPLTTNSYPTTNGILVQGLSTNIASVFVGGSGVASVGASGGYEIQAGQAVPQTCNNANLVFIVGPNNTDGVCWTVL